MGNSQFTMPWPGIPRDQITWHPVVMLLKHNRTLQGVTKVEFLDRGRFGLSEAASQP